MDMMSLSHLKKTILFGIVSYLVHNQIFPVGSQMPCLIGLLNWDPNSIHTSDLDVMSQKSLLI